MDTEHLDCYKVEVLSYNDYKYKVVYYYCNYDKSFTTTETKIIDKDYYHYMLKRNEKYLKLRNKELNYI